MRIVIGNLPDDVTEEGIKEALKPFAPVEKIKLVMAIAPQARFIGDKPAAPKSAATTGNNNKRNNRRSNRT